MSMSLKLGAPAAALVPLFWCIIVPSGHAHTPLSITMPAPPALAFRQYALDLGSISPTNEVRGTFIFVNRGKTTVEIKHIVLSCSRLTPQIERKLIEPAEDGRVVLRVQPSSEKPGP